MRFSQRPRRSRAIRFENLESRHLLAVDWRNPADALDVNDDQRITAFDALEVINELNLNSAHPLASPKPAGEPFWDVTGNSAINAFDALLVINHLNLFGAGNYLLAESAGRLATEHAVTITAGELAAGARQYQLEINAQFDTADPLARDDVFLVYLVDPATGQTVVDAGSPGTSLFSLSGTTAEVPNELVQWNGSRLTIDLSDLPAETLELRLQLLNVNDDAASFVVVKPLSNVVDPLGTPGSPGTLRSAPAQPAGAVDLTPYLVIPGLTVEMENSSYLASTGRFSAEIRLFNDTFATVTAGVMRLPGLSVGVLAANASGLATGTPYWNFASLIGPAGLAPGARTGWVQVTLDVTNNQSFVWAPEAIGYSSWEHLRPFGIFGGTITEAEEQHIFEFPLDKEDDLLVVPLKYPGTTATTSPQTRLIRPQAGAEFGYPTNLRATFDKYEAQRTGIYQFELTGREKGDFAVEFLKLNNAEVLTLGSERKGYFDPRLGGQTYTFDAVAGQTIMLESRLPASQTRYGRWKVYTETFSDAWAWFATSAGDQELMFPETGRYYLVYSPPDYTTELTPYDFVVRSIVETQHPAEFSVTQNVTFASVGQRHVYSFTGTPGQQVIFDSLLPVTDPTRFNLVNPSGVRVPITEAKPHLIDQAGTWQLIVRGDQPGTFSFRFHNLADLPLLTSGTQISGTVNQYDNNFYRASAVGGDLLQLIRTLESDNVDVKTTGPSVEFVGRQSVTGPFELFAAGDYAVQVLPIPGDTETRNYTLDVTQTLDAPVTNTGMDVDYTGTLNPSASATLATFTAAAGTQILLDWLTPASESQIVYFELNGGGHSGFTSGEGSIVTLVDSGTYQIRGRNLTTSSQPYGFRVINVSNAPVAADGSIVSEVLSGNRTFVRRVDTQVGERMILDPPANATFSSSVNLTFTGGGLSQGGSTFRIYNVTRAGTQYLIMKQTGTSDVPVSFQVRYEHVAPILPLDTPIVGTLDASNDSHLFRFDVEAGQTLYLDSLLLSNPGAVQVQVSDHRISPDVITTTRAHAWFFDEPGEHYLWLHSDATTPAAYTIRASFISATPTPVALDSVVTGTLASGERHVYSFEGRENQVLFFDGLDETGPAAQLTLWQQILGSPDSQRTSAGNGTYQLRSDGEYRLVVGEMVGTYEFRIVDVANLPLLPPDVSVTGSVAADEQARLWRFPTDYFQFIRIDSAASLAMPFEGTMAMYDARGVVSDSTNLRTNNDLDAQFQYEGNNVLVMNAGTLPYNYDVRLRPAERPIIATSVGSTVSGVLQDPNDGVEYTVPVLAGQHIYITAVTSASVSIRDPDGLLATGLDGNTFLAKQSGEYRVRFSASGIQYNTAYRLEVFDVATVPLLPLGTPVTGTTTQAGSLYYRLPATAGQRFKFDYQSLTGGPSSNAWKLVGPEATNVFTTAFSNGDQTVTLPETGNYLLVVSFGTGTANYAFQVDELVQPVVTVAGLDQTYTDSVVGSERKYVEFTGYAGQRVLFDVLNQSGLSTLTKLLAPDGSTVDSSASSDELYILPLSGTYQFEFYANGSATPINYSVCLIDASNLPITPHNTPINITYNQSHQGGVWAFEATVGDLLGIDVDQTPFNASFRAFEPDGKQLSFTTGEFVRIAKTGRYYLTMSGIGLPAQTAGTVQIWNPSLQPVISTEDPITVNFGTTEWHYYTFDLTAGERFFVTPVTAFPQFTDFIFRGPANQIFTISLDDSVTPDVVTVPQTGRYTLYLARYVATPAQFTFQIHRAAIQRVTGLARG